MSNILVRQEILMPIAVPLNKRVAFRRCAHYLFMTLLHSGLFFGLIPRKQSLRLPFSRSHSIFLALSLCHLDTWTNPLRVRIEKIPTKAILQTPKVPRLFIMLPLLVDILVSIRAKFWPVPLSTVWKRDSIFFCKFVNEFLRYLNSRSELFEFFECSLRRINNFSVECLARLRFSLSFSLLKLAWRWLRAFPDECSSMLLIRIEN